MYNHLNNNFKHSDLKLNLNKSLSENYKIKKINYKNIILTKLIKSIQINFISYKRIKKLFKSLKNKRITI